MPTVSLPAERLSDDRAFDHLSVEASHLLFNPPSLQWCNTSLASLQLPPVQADGFSADEVVGLPTVVPNCTNPPHGIHRVLGDGACLFRCISWWLSRSEAYHSQVNIEAES